MNGYQDNSSREKCLPFGNASYVMPGGRHFWQSLHKYRTANLSAGNTLCWFGASCFGKWAFCRRGQKSDLPARIRRQEETDRRRHFWEAEIIRSAWDMYRFSPGSSRMRWKLHSGGELFFRIWICRL